ncbi:MAG: DEAD/DEAH box helicase [Deltaproteobacteria bacterium]|nr:DEAD/DEAH box helicase [Deltaproteobacteria bacterium]
MFNSEKEIEFLVSNNPAWVRMHDTSFRSLLIYEYLRASGRPVLVVAPSGGYADRLVEELSWVSSAGIAPRLFPSWGIIPYNGIFPVIDVQAERITAISEHVCNKGKDVMVASAKALMPLLPQPSLLASLELRINVRDRLDITQLALRLVELGYVRQGISTSIGEFSIRGGIVDIFPPNSGYPVRIEMLSDTVESIRHFMVADQRSFQKIETVFVPPVTEFLMKDPSVRGDGPGIVSPEELPYDDRTDIFDYIDKGTDIVIVSPVDVDNTLDRYFEDIHRHHLQALRDGRTVNDVERMFASPDRIRQRLAAYKTIWIDSSPPAQRTFLGIDKVSPLGDIDAWLSSGTKRMYSAFEYIKHLAKEDRTAVLIMKSSDRIRHLGMVLSDSGIEINRIEGPYPGCMSRVKQGMNIVDGTLERGFVYDGIPFITEADLFSAGKGRKGRQAYRQVHGGEPLSLEELKFGTYIVHREYGIGRLTGITTMDIDTLRIELIVVEYRDNAKLYLPVERANMLSQYIPSSDAAPVLDKLGGSAFMTRVKKVKESLYEIAHEFINNQAIRELKGGFSFSTPDSLYQAFEDGFPYEETMDQKKAIEDVLTDMMSSRPMDRLVCGDSGYGKTEVAMRAAFKAVMDNKQVALLAPTTILSEQHYRTFSERFKEYPVNIKVLNRFRRSSERRAILKALASGEVDVLIGTHAILKEAVRFKSLGLVIIDEEHKFGVDHKEALKRFNPSADILVITATPIPRTLKMALSGIKDISIIATPPSERKATQCHIMKYSDSGVHDLIVKEIERGGQVFAVSRKIKGLEQLADRIAKVVPSASVAVVHGQMSAKHIESIMSRFIRKEINVLVSTAIVESGLDIPSANTIVIYDADAFGTSELYQLKGRVGRSGQVGYVYFIIPFDRTISPQAIARLKIVASSSELSSGFRLAIHDMEMRGAGNIAGRAQSGHIDAIGLELYSELVREAMAGIRGEAYEEPVEPYLNFPVPAYIPGG